MTAPLRNDWKESLLKGIELCEKNGSRGDADTLDDVLAFISTPAIVKKANAVRHCTEKDMK